MTEPTYAAAQKAADRIHRHFQRYPLPSSECPATLPDAATLASLIDTAFWTSLRREELYTPRISLAFAGPHQVTKPISFATPLPLIPGDLTRLAAAVERAGIHLCVWPAPDQATDGIRVWGIARTIPPSCIVIETVMPGLLVVKQSPPHESGKFRNVAVLQGDSIKIIDPHVQTSPQGSIMEALFRSAGNEVNALLQLAVSMRVHGRGGMLLVVPDSSPNGTDEWRESISTPIKYEVTPPFLGLSNLLKKDETGRASRNWEDAMSRAVDAIAGLTAVDGATILNAQYDLLAFGAKIIRRKGSPQVPEVVITEAVEDSEPVIADTTELGGTRHFSAAQFTHDQHNAVAMVASQDGRFTVFGWSEPEQKVHAHRIDALLL